MPSNDYTQYVPLKRVVSYFLDENDKSIGSFDKAWVIAFRGLVLLNQTMAAEPKTIRIPLNGNKTVNFPNDYLSWTKIGILNNNGEVSTLRINNALTTLNDTISTRLSTLTPDISDNTNLLLAAPYYYNYYYGGEYQTMFGVGGGLVQYGECKFDEKNRVIIFPPDFRYDSVILEYLSSPESDDDYLIPIVLQESLIAFLNWKFKLGTESQFWAAATVGRRSLPGKKVILQEFQRVIRETNGFYIKA